MSRHAALAATLVLVTVGGWHATWAAAPATPGPPERPSEQPAAAAPGADAKRSVDVAGVVVTGTRRQVPRPSVPDVVQVIDREQIEALNPSTLGELLRLTTGVSVETGTGSGLPKRHIVGLNGLPASYTLVLLDGVRLLSEHIHTGRNLELVPVHSIERIEIIRGAASAQYGADAIGGVVNVITRKAGDRRQTLAHVGAGSYGSYRGEVAWLAPVSPLVRLSTFVSREWSEGAPLKAPAHRLDSMGYERLGVQARVDVGPSDTSKVYGWLHWTDNVAQWREAEADSELATGVLGATHALTRSLSVTAQMAASRWEAEVAEERNVLLHPEAWVAWSLAPGHVLTGGGGWRRQTFERTAVSEAEQSTLGAFVQYEGRLLESLTAMPALRVDNVNDAEPVLSPKLTLLWAPSWIGQVRSSVSRGFHAPTPQELHEQGYGHGGRARRFGNPDLEPERSTTYSLGVDLLPGRALQASLYAHYSHVQNMIVPVYEGAWDEDPEHDVWRRTNIAEATVYGAEARVSYRLGRDLVVAGGYTFSEQSADGGRQLPYDPGSRAFTELRGALRLGGSWRLAGFATLSALFDRSAWSWKPARGAPVDDSTGGRTPLHNHQKLDAGLTVAYRETYFGYLSGHNLLGQDLEYLDDAYTVLEGEPTLSGGLRCAW